MLKDILAISGEPGLFKLVSKTSKGIIVEHLETKKRMPTYATAKISALEDIAIFTEDSDVPLKDVYRKINEKENGGPAISHKAKPEELKRYFEEVLPDYDKERVYVSDIKKAVQWYNILHGLDMLNFEEEEKEEGNRDQSEQKDINDDKKDT